MSDISKNTKRMVLTRGAPGSGKSTLARQIYDDCPSPLKAICSTDDFRSHTDGVYKYDGKQNRYMHDKTHKLVLSLAQLAYDLIIVDNTHTTWREMRNFVLIGIMFGYEIELVEPNAPWSWDVDECTKRNVHNVPRDAIAAMFDRFVAQHCIYDKIDALRIAYESGLPNVPDGI